VPKKFRPNVAVFVLNRRGEILVCERNDYPGSWQLPQGGIDKNEKAKDAAFRELYEEIGTRSATLIKKIPGTFRYTWPKQLWKRGYKGQEQTFFIFRISPWAKIDLARAANKHRSIKQEFQSFEFIEHKKFLKRVHGFKKVSYKRALKVALSRYPSLFES
jgi:putative (di)nucleoside polyphosphate hydrolase